MAGDEHVIVLGADEEVATPPRRGRARSPLLVLIPVAVLFVALIGFVLAPQDQALIEVDPSDLPPPAEPDRITLEDAAPSPVTVEGLPGLAFGWDRVDLVGTVWGVTAAEGDDGGWLIVTDGPNGPMAHVSTDGVSWRASTPGLDGVDLRAAVDGQSLAISARSQTGGPATVVLSDDGGSSWVATSLPEEASVIRWMEFVDGRLYAVGGLLADGVDPRSRPALPGMWQLQDEGWAPILVDTNQEARLNAIIEGREGEVWVLGASVDGPSAWTVEGEALQRMPISIGDDHLGRAFIDVVLVGTHHMALVGADGLRTSGRDLVISDDLLIWDDALQAGSDLVDIESAGDGSLLARRAQGGQLWAFAEGREVLVDSFHEAPGAEGESMPYIGALAAGGGVSLLAGSIDGGPALLVRGVIGSPVSQPVEIAGDGWASISTIDVVSGDLFDGPVGSFATSSGAFVAAAQQIFEVVDPDSETPQLVASLPNPATVGVGPGGLWASGGSAVTTRLYTNGRDGVWASEEIPLAAVQAVTEIDGETFAFGWTGDGFAAVRHTAAGEWLPASAELDGIDGMAGIVDGLLAVTSAGGVVASADGSSWEQVGRGRVFGVPGTVPFLIGEQATTLTLLDSWPQVESVEIPDPEPIWVVRSGEDLWVAHPNRLFVGNPDDGWARIPLGLEHGIEGVPLPVIGSPIPQLVVLGDGQLRLVRWEGDVTLRAPTIGRR
jgi:hypothetical protein